MGPKSANASRVREYGDKAVVKATGLGGTACAECGVSDVKPAAATQLHKTTMRKLS
jgi:hypothetical protein